jgi:hypothetical protein
MTDTKATVALTVWRYHSNSINRDRRGAHRWVDETKEQIQLIAASWGPNHNDCVVAEPESFPNGLLKDKRIVVRDPVSDPLAIRDLGWVNEGSQIWEPIEDLLAFNQMPRDLCESSEILLDEKLFDFHLENLHGKELKHLSRRELADTTAHLRNQVRAVWRIQSRLDEMSEHEHLLSALTTGIGNRGVMVAKDQIRDQQLVARKASIALLEAFPWGPNYKGDPGDSVALEEHCESIGETPPSVAKLSDPELKQFRADHPKIAELIDAQKDYRALQHRVEVLAKLNARSTDSGHLRYELKYVGSPVTRRWAGAGGLNMLGLPKGELLGTDIRRCIVPRDGKRFVVADYSAFEARVALHIAGAGVPGDPYLELAKRAQGRFSSDSGAVQVSRLHAKLAFLALIFGGTAAKLIDQGIPVVIATTLEEEFHGRWPEVRKYYSSLEKQLRDTYATRHSIDFNLPGKLGSIRYWDAELTHGATSTLVAAKVRGGDLEDIYPSRIFQNKVQATSREIFADALLTLENAGHAPVLFVHDEITIEVNKKGAKKAGGEIAKAMTSAAEDGIGLSIPVSISIRTAYSGEDIIQSAESSNSN